MNAADALRDLNLEQDTIGFVIQCPWTSEEVRSEWFVDQFQAETVQYLQKHGQRDGLTIHLAHMFHMGSREVIEKLEAWRKASMIYAPVTLLPQHCDRLRDLYTRREKLALAERLARAAFQGVAVAA